MGISSNADLIRTLLGHWYPYLPFNPSPKQLAFCALPHREALAGGAAGGGKSVVLLMDALRHVTIPGYQAIIFRRTLTDLLRADGLLDVAHKWLRADPEVRYEARIHTFKWPNDASLTFGYCGSATAWEHYQGGSYQFIGWDESTQHALGDYEEMLTRLRVKKCQLHPTRFREECNVCQMSLGLQKIPLRVRSATNPGGRGHFWVKKRFKLWKNKEMTNPASGKPGVWLSGDGNKPFIPFFYTDNPGIDHDAYRLSFAEMSNEQRRVEMEEGDWDMIPSGIFRPEWFVRRWKWQNGYYVVTGADGAGLYSFLAGALRIFSVLDPAYSTREGVGERSYRMAGGSELEPCYTVLGTYGITPRGDLLLLDIKRLRAEAPQIFEMVKGAYTEWRPMYIAVESNGCGGPIFQQLCQMGLPCRDFRTVNDKPANSMEAQIRVKQGKVLLPQEGNALWLEDFLGELCCWTGHPHEIADQVDVLSNGVHQFTALCGSMDRDGTILSHRNNIPEVCKYNKHLINTPNMYGL